MKFLVRWIYGQALAWTIIIGAYSLLAIVYMAKQIWTWAPLVLSWIVLSPVYLAIWLWMLTARKRIWFGR